MKRTLTIKPIFLLSLVIFLFSFSVLFLLPDRIMYTCGHREEGYTDVQVFRADPNPYPDVCEGEWNANYALKPNTLGQFKESSAPSVVLASALVLLPITVVLFKRNFFVSR